MDHSLVFHVIEIDKVKKQQLLSMAVVEFVTSTHSHQIDSVLMWNPLV
jgi:hypothetical protein